MALKWFGGREKREPLVEREREKLQINTHSINVIPNGFNSQTHAHRAYTAQYSLHFSLDQDKWTLLFPSLVLEKQKAKIPKDSVWCSKHHSLLVGNQNNTITFGLLHTYSTLFVQTGTKKKIYLSCFNGNWR